MKTLDEHLTQYAAYHRDRRNVLTHFIGIPMIVVAVAVLLSRPGWAVAGIAMSPAVLVALGSLAFYFMLDAGLGCIMAVVLGLSLWFGAWAAAQSTAVWLAIGVGGFAVGWIFQFVGHHFEGRKPAFVDDLIGLLVGPLFVTAELLLALGLRHDLHAAMGGSAPSGAARSGA